MKVRHQLLLLSLVLIMGIGAVSLLLRYTVTNRGNGLLRDKLAETRDGLAKNLMKLNGADMRAYAADYGVWDQCVEFVTGGRDTVWAYEHLTLPLQRYRVDYIWVLDSACRKRYTSFLNSGKGINGLPIPYDHLKNYLQTTRDSSFFIRHNGQLVEVFLGRVLPVIDAARSSSAQGYLLLGRVLNENYMAHLQALSSEVQFQVTDSSRKISKKIDVEEATLRFGMPLLSYNRDTVAVLNITRSYTGLQTYYQYLRYYGIAYVLFILLISVLFYVFMHHRLLRPVTALSGALKKAESTSLRRHLNQSNEFGELARAVAVFLSQNQELKREIETRKLSQANLQSALYAKETADAERQQAEEFLTRQQELFQLNNTSYNSLEAMMKAAIPMAAEGLRCERVGIWFYTGSFRCLKADNVYRRSSKEFLPGKTVMESELPVYFSHLRKEVLLAADEALTHPATVELIESHLIPKGITSLLDVPIRSGNRLIGLVCLEHTGPARQWTYHEKVFAKSLADVIAIRYTSDELKAAERNLIKNQQRFEETQELAQIGTWEYNFFTREVVWSREMYRIFNIEQAEGQNLFDLYATNIHHEDTVCFEQALQRVMDTKETGTIECRLLSPGGVIRYVMAIAEALKSPNSGTVIGLRGTVQDITKQKQAALAKSEFLSCMSHEIRTPINGVIGIANLLQEEQLTERQTEYVKTLNFSAQHLSTVVSDILDFSKIESGHLTFERVSFNLEKNCHHVFNLFAQKAAEKNLVFRYQPAVLNDYSLYGDYVRLNQVLSNLLSNAIKFTEQGSVDFSYTITAEDRHKITVLFSVKDTGIGIAHKQKAQIFESFSQADESITRQYGGTGLGLTISKKLVELQGGSIRVVSIPGEGSEFLVDLTFDKHVYEPQAVRHVTSAEKSATKNLQGMRVLVAEDNHVNAMVLTSFLKKWSIESRVAKDGSEALKFLYGEEFDLVLMDIQMPNVDGIEATRRIRRSPDKKLKNIPVVAFTADASVDTHRELLSIGFNHCMTKPFNPEVLFSFLKKAYSAS